MDVKTLAEQLLFTTVRIEGFNNTVPISTGTGFIFSYPAPNGDYRFLVTNKHVVAGATRGVITFTEASNDQPKLGKVHQWTISNFGEIWFGHPNSDIDVAITSLSFMESQFRQASDIDLFYRFVGPFTIPTEEQTANFDAIEDIIFIGYPNGIWDTKNFLPVVRRGITASPIGVDFNGQPKFLIDASVFPGSSGSPVFLYNAGAYRPNKVNQNEFTVGTRLMFLGILASVYYRETASKVQPIKMAAYKAPGTIMREMIDLGVVYKASTIVETVELFLKNRGLLPN